MIKEKRTSLENFIKEQLIGPGGCNYRYSVQHDENEKPENGCEFGEVLNTTPGSIYSSAILFPQQAKEDLQSIMVDETESNSDESVDSEDINEISNNEELEEGVQTNSVFHVV